MKGKYAKLTVWFVLVVIIAIAIWDGIVIYQEGTTATISYLLRDWSKEYPAFTFAMGFTMGHLFWGMKKTPETESLNKKINELIEKNKILDARLRENK